MCAKKENPFYVNVGNRFYHRDVLFPVKGDHAGTDEDPDSEFVEHDSRCEHETDFVSSPESIAIANEEGDEEFFRKHCIMHLFTGFNVDDSSSTYMCGVGLPKIPFSFDTSDIVREGFNQSALPIVPMINRDAYEARKDRRLKKNVFKKRICYKDRKRGNETIRGAIVDLEYSIDYPFSQCSILVAKPRVQR